MLEVAADLFDFVVHAYAYMHSKVSLRACASMLSKLKEYASWGRGEKDGEGRRESNRY